MYEKLIKIWVGLSKSDDVLNGEYKLVHTDYIHDLKKIIDDLEEDTSKKIEKLNLEFGIDYTKSCYENMESLLLAIATLGKKVSEIIDYINEGKNE